MRRRNKSSLKKQLKRWMAVVSWETSSRQFVCGGGDAGTTLRRRPVVFVNSVY